VGCGADRPGGGRVLVLGIDGASPRVVQPLLDQDRLPHLQALASRGASGPLRSLKRLLSPVVWTSAATGKRARKHGILGFVRREEGGHRALFQSSDRRGHALWNIVSDAGLSVGVVNWWTTYPPEIVRGVIVSDHARPQSLEAEQQLRGVSVSAAGATTFPESWGERIPELLAAQDALAELARTTAWDLSTRLAVGVAQGADVEPLREWIEERIELQTAADASTTRIALHIEAELRPHLLMVLLVGVDRLSHLLWAGIEDPDRHRAAGDALERYYEFTDALVGRLAEGFGPRDLIVVLSDHGFESAGPGKLSGTHASERARDGVLIAHGPGIAPGSPTLGTSVLDVTPTILAWLGLPVGADMDGRPAAFLDAGDVATIPTHDTRPIRRLEGENSGVEVEILEELRALGYIE
jgi:predicted AlkP superfamily phosphohydrolase/phosphomutase